MRYCWRRKLIHILSYSFSKRNLKTMSTMSNIHWRKTPWPKVCTWCLWFLFLFEVYRPTREFFTHMETSTLPVKGCKFRPVLGTYGHCSKGSLTCHTYCDTGLPFIMFISEDPWHSHLFPSVWQWSCHYLFLRLRSVATGDRTPISRMQGERSTFTTPRHCKTCIYL